MSIRLPPIVVWENGLAAATDLEKSPDSSIAHASDMQLSMSALEFSANTVLHESRRT